MLWHFKVDSVKTWYNSINDCKKNVCRLTQKVKYRYIFYFIVKLFEFQMILIS